MLNAASVVAQAARPIVWAIGGSDSGGGAGIQADLQAINLLGGHACTLITAVTAQNSVELSVLNPVADDVLLSQWQALAEDLRPVVIKIGLVATPAQAQLLTRLIREAKQRWPTPPFVIYDPVLRASTGDATHDGADIRPALHGLIGEVDLLTPNADEATALTGTYLINAESCQDAITRLLALGCGSVLLKGGHLGIDDDRCIDRWSNGTQQRYLSQPRLDTVHGHGSGCSLAAAIAVLLGLGYALEDALTLANAYLHQGLVASAHIGRGPGPVCHLGWPQQLSGFPRTAFAAAELAAASMPFAPCPDHLGLYPVVDSLAWLERLLAWGVRTLQLRIKDRAAADVEPLIAQAVALGRRYRARLFINDYWQLAIKHGAYGVHLGQEDLADADLAAIQRAGLRLGLSTHGVFELLRAYALRPSYVAIGHIFATQTKAMPSSPQGVTRLRQQVALLQGAVPTVAIGGISVERVAQVQASGVGGIALVSAITQAANPEQTTLALLAQLGAGEEEA